MSDARAHEHNWPVKGALIRNPEHADIDGASNFSTTTTGSWVTITANSKTLQVVFTPDTDCRIEVILSGLVNHSNVSAGVYLGIDVNGANVKHALAHNPGVSIFHEKLVTHEFAATAGTTYTITGKTLTSTAGTVTVNKDAAATELYIKVFKKP